VEVDHVTIYRWVQRFTPLLADAARASRHAVGARWWVDETYVRVAGRWRYVYRAIDQSGQVVDVFVSPRRDAKAAHRFFERAIGTVRITPVEVVTDRAAIYLPVLEELLPAAWHRTDQYANNRIECDHGRLKAAAADAGTQTRSKRHRDHHWACVQVERSARPLRTGCWRTGQPADGRRVRRASPRDLIRDRGRGFRVPDLEQCNSAHCSVWCRRRLCSGQRFVVGVVDDGGAEVPGGAPVPVSCWAWRISSPSRSMARW
jgi:transposase-like protein